MKKILLFFCILITFVPCVCHARVAENNGTDIRLVGTANEGNIQAAVEVYRGGKTFEDLLTSPDSYKDILIYFAQFKTEANGSYAVDFRVDKSTEPSGMFTAIVYTEKNRIAETFLYTNPDSALAKLKETEQKYSENKMDEIANIIRDYPYDLWIDDMCKDYYTDIADKIVKYLDKNSAFDADTASEIFRVSAGISALENNSSDLSDIFEFPELFGLENSSIKDFLNKEYLSESVKKSITERLKGKKYESPEDFDAKLTEAFVLSVVAEPDGYGNTKEVMTAFSDKIGTGASGSDERYNFVSGKNYSDYKSLRDAFDGYSDSVNSGGGSSSGGKVSSVTVGSGAAVPQVNLPVINKYIFDDVKDVAWAVEGIVALAEKGIISGRGDRIFEPHSNITRAEFVKILTGLFYPDYKADDVNFGDVTPGDWYSPYVAKACKLGLVQGYENGYFGANDFITRQDMATILYRLTKNENYDYKDFENEDGFSDDDRIEQYAKEAVYALRSIGVINGIDEMTFAPTENATRAQAVKMIYTLSEKL